MPAQASSRATPAKANALLSGRTRVTGIGVGRGTPGSVRVVWRFRSTGYQHSFRAHVGRVDSGCAPGRDRLVCSSSASVAPRPNAREHALRVRNRLRLALVWTASGLLTRRLSSIRRRS